MERKNPDGSVCYTIGACKNIRSRIGKQPGDSIHVTIRERKQGAMDNEKVYRMDFAKVYPLYVSKVEKKGRMKREVDEVIRWLTGYSQEELEEMLEKTVTLGDFFRRAPALNENRRLIRGVVCGVRVEDIEEPLLQEIRYLDKLVDELAKGKSMDKILRK